MSQNFYQHIRYDKFDDEDTKKEKFERALRRFSRKILKSNILEQYMETLYYLKPSEKKKLKRNKIKKNI